MTVGAMVWLVIAVVIAIRPSGPITERVPSTLIPTAMVAFLIGSVGLKAWLGDFRPRGGRPGGASGLASGLEAMSSQRQRAVEGAGPEMMKAG